MRKGSSHRNLWGDFPPLRTRKLFSPGWRGVAPWRNTGGARTARTTRTCETCTRPAFAPTTARADGKGNRLFAAREVARSHLSVSAWAANRSFAPKFGLSFRQVAVKSLGPRCAIGTWRHTALCPRASQQRYKGPRAVWEVIAIHAALCPGHAAPEVGALLCKAFAREPESHLFLGDAAGAGLEKSLADLSGAAGFPGVWGWAEGSRPAAFNRPCAKTWPVTKDRCLARSQPTLRQTPWSPAKPLWPRSFLPLTTR